MSWFAKLKRMWTGAPIAEIETFIYDALVDGPWCQEAIVDACIERGFKSVREGREWFAWRINREILSPGIRDHRLTFWYEGMGGENAINVGVMGFPYCTKEWAEKRKRERESFDAT